MYRQIFSPKILVASFAFLLVPTVTAASSFHSGFGAGPALTVNGLTNGRFEVIEARGAGPRGIWCAAARYAAYTLGAQSGRLSIAQGRGSAISAKGRKGVVFQLGGTARSGYSVSVTQLGASLPVVHALQFCKDYDILFPDF